MAAPSQPKLLNTPTATFVQPESSIVLTTGSTIRINAPASEVFGTILNVSDYSKWNSWCPSLTFPENLSIHQSGSIGVLATVMPGMQRTLHVPVKILEVSSSPVRHLLAWTGQMMPTWFARAARMQTVVPLGEGECELRQWESMSGWGAYLLNWLFGMQRQLDEMNLVFARDLKEFCEKSGS